MIQLHSLWNRANNLLVAITMCRPLAILRRIEAPIAQGFCTCPDPTWAKLGALRGNGPGLANHSPKPPVGVSWIIQGPVLSEPEAVHVA